MADISDNVIRQVVAERNRQDTLWDRQFDDRNTLNDWSTYIGIYMARAAEMGRGRAQQRINLVKVAALAVAALDAFDRNDGFPARHYDVPGVTARDDSTRTI